MVQWAAPPPPENKQKGAIARSLLRIRKGVFRRADVLAHDGVQHAFLVQRRQGVVDRIQQVGVFQGDGDGVILQRVLGIQDLEALVVRHKGFRGLVVDDHAVHLAGDQGQHGVRAGLVLEHGVLAEIVGAVDIAGGGFLDADQIGRAHV